MSQSEALFLDGPLAGKTKVFDREQPPPFVHLPLRQGKPKVDYKRDVNPFSDRPRWVYLVEEEEVAG